MAIILPPMRVPVTGTNIQLPVHRQPAQELSDAQVAGLINKSKTERKLQEINGTKLLLVEQAILTLSRVCDGAHQIDEQGFNGGHAYLGNSFAQQLREGKRLNHKQLEIAYMMVPTYLNTQLKGLVQKHELEIEHETQANKAEMSLKERAKEVSRADVDFFARHAVMATIGDKDRSFVTSLVKAWPKVSERQEYWLKYMSLMYANSVPEGIERPPQVSFVVSADKEKNEIPFDLSILAGRCLQQLPRKEFTDVDQRLQQTSTPNRGRSNPFISLLPKSSSSAPADRTTGKDVPQQSPTDRGTNQGALLQTSSDGEVGEVQSSPKDGISKNLATITPKMPNNPFKLPSAVQQLTKSIDLITSPELAAEKSIAALMRVQQVRALEQQKGGQLPPDISLFGERNLLEGGDATESLVVPELHRSGEPISSLPCKIQAVTAASPLETTAVISVSKPGTVKFMRAGKLVELVPDPSQLAAVLGLKGQKFGCLTGAAGTGKTTVERILLQEVEKQAGQVDLRNYGKVNPDQDADERIAPAIACAAYTGKAMQQMKKALPEEYHSRCYTIHKLLGYHPIFEDYDAPDPDHPGQFVNKVKRIFVPLYDETNKMPWRIIVLDEASMIPIQLWNKLIAACTADCRIMMIGDINQLPPVHGRSVFGFSMLKWPSFELTHIHRQKGEDNPIVDNAWRILKGHFPVNVPGRFDMIRIANEEFEAFNTTIKACILLQRKGEFNPIDQDTHQGDMLIVGQNKGNLGQPLINQRLLGYFNPPPPDHSTEVKGRRQMIIAGYEKRFFAVGDKVMVTVNDHDIGVTNGMTGAIVNIARNGNFSGQVGGKAVMTADQIEKLMENMLEIDLEAEVDQKHKEDDQYKKRAASHIVDVDFGVNEDGERIQVAFDTTGGVNSLIHAYAATCHKCQGSEFPTVIVLCHSKNHRMLYREWLYTAVTRASQRVVLLYNDKGLSLALNRQRIKGANIKEKAKAFIELQENDDTSLPELPNAEEI